MLKEIQSETYIKIKDSSIDIHHLQRASERQKKNIFKNIGLNIPSVK